MRNLSNQINHYHCTIRKIEKLQQEKIQLEAVILRTCQGKPEQFEKLTPQELEFVRSLQDYYYSNR